LELKFNAYTIESLQTIFALAWHRSTLCEHDILNSSFLIFIDEGSNGAHEHKIVL